MPRKTPPPPRGPLPFIPPRLRFQRRRRSGGHGPPQGARPELLPRSGGLRRRGVRRGRLSRGVAAVGRHGGAPVHLFGAASPPAPLTHRGASATPPTPRAQRQHELLPGTRIEFRAKALPGSPPPRPRARRGRRGRGEARAASRALFARSRRRKGCKSPKIRWRPRPGSGRRFGLPQGRGAGRLLLWS